MPKRPKRRLLIDIRIPDDRGFRTTVRGDDLTVSGESLDAWVPVCERILDIVTEHFNRERPAPAPEERDDE